ncbi:hypothetical protein QQ054_02125 [Oscillatoria amoena NRMC-F 0135]|nr:hypothetical protein [Geitlerinema splendidum]MDL5044840.1 hypothetical protein [Oscillatoria amoena NRMC-F 0135]
MNDHTYSTQPHFPDNEYFKRLVFHFRELNTDMVALTRDAEKLSTIAPNSPQAFWDLRSGINHLMIGIEHDIFHHLSEAIELAHQITKKKSLSELLEKITLLEAEFNPENSSLLSDRQAENPRKLIIGLQNLTLDVRQVLKKINCTPWYKQGVNQDLEQLENCLKQMTEILVDRALPCARNLYLQAFQLHQITDKFSAIEEE